MSVLPKPRMLVINERLKGKETGKKMESDLPHVDVGGLKEIWNAVGLLGTVCSFLEG